MSFFLAEMRIGLTEEFCVGKSELRGEKKVGLSLLPEASCREVREISTPSVLFSPKIWVSRGVFLSRLWARNSGG